MDMAQLSSLTAVLKENICKVIMGKEEQIEKILLCLYCGGHILLEDIPGTGKTTLAKALARSLDCSFKRIQFTPDLLPSELTGINYYNQKEQAFQFRPGAIFTNILLADEINRATPRTQSSLLECMEERQCSVDGVTYPMAQPFLVVATQNPVEIQGTFPLPEAQLDRFFMKLSLGYPDAQQERAMLTAYQLPDDGDLSQLLRSDGANNRSGYSSAALDAALDSLSSARSEEAYYNAMQRVYDCIIADLPLYTICMRTRTQIAGDCLTVPNVIHAGEPYRGIETWTHAPD